MGTLKKVGYINLAILCQINGAAAAMTAATKGVIGVS